ncbi:hypothetical protein YC2023_002787 [Brassica napus]
MAEPKEKEKDMLKLVLDKVVWTNFLMGFRQRRLSEGPKFLHDVIVTDQNNSEIYEDTTRVI